MIKNTEHNAMAVVLGINLGTLGIARSLSRCDIEVLAIDSDLNTPYFYSRYYRSLKCQDLYSDALVDYLIKVAKNEAMKPVLYLTNDANVRMVSRNRDVLSKYYRINLPAEDIVETLMNKKRFADFSKKEGFLTPATFCVSSVNELESVVGKLEYPCIMKPYLKDAIWSKSEFGKVFKINNVTEAYSTYNMIASITGDVILQEWMEGPDSNIYFCLVYYDSKSNLVANFIGKKIRQWPPECGYTSSAVSCDNKYILSETLRLFNLIKYKGMGSLEFKMDAKNGRFRIIEPTVGRINLQSAISDASGINLHYIAYCDILGRDIKIGVQVNGMTWIREDADFLSAIYYLKGKKLNVFSWLKMLMRRKTLAIFKWDDPIPFLIIIIVTLHRINKIAVKILFNYFTTKVIAKSKYNARKTLNRN